MLQIKRWADPRAIDLRIKEGIGFMSLFDYTIKELEAKLHNHEITVEDLVKESYAQIKKKWMEMSMHS